MRPSTSRLRLTKRCCTRLAVHTVKKCDTLSSYRLSGDYNPLHADDCMAQVSGGVCVRVRVRVSGVGGREAVCGVAGVV